MPSSRVSSWPRDHILVSCAEGEFFTSKPLVKPKIIDLMDLKFFCFHQIVTYLNALSHHSFTIYAIGSALQFHMVAL